MTAIHGHEVLQMMLEADTAFTTDTLVAAIEAKFGGEARYHTCSAEDMTARELVAFLEARGKFVPSGNGFSTAAEKICSH